MTAPASWLTGYKRTNDTPSLLFQKYTNIIYNSYTNISKNWLDDSNIEKILTQDREIHTPTFVHKIEDRDRNHTAEKARNTLTKHGFIYIKKNATKCPRQNTDQAEIVADFDRQSAKQRQRYRCLNTDTVHKQSTKATRGGQVSCRFIDSKRDVINSTIIFECTIVHSWK